MLQIQEKLQPSMCYFTGRINCGLIKKYLMLTGLVLLSIAVCGCESVHYYSQAIQGQYRILEERQPISEIMADPETPEFLRERLSAHTSRAAIC